MKVAATAAEDQQPSHILLGIKIFTNSADTAGGGTAFRCTASWTRIHSSTAQLTLARLETEDAELEQPGGVVLMPPDRPRERPERKL
ncbi:uncharacterized protein LOC112345765 isoform X2 [Selaginella moellendorffii]|uniref:uncharacterized protein LOC112345765 isoform X2 n=1 Tax=Selaginella moellendorffii TaxID=88036 RepID=UPI000D1C4B38|nr:uncharacterized protein LOC112345765 isoform X2 [Selaginella moellendorffii]|eukprot:XP_024528878.1 uncharacterized protein LOC112345765 isoform X2 [Selaginella moellendorffii]